MEPTFISYIKSTLPVALIFVKEYCPLAKKFDTTVRLEKLSRQAIFFLYVWGEKFGAYTQTNAQNFLLFI